MTIESPRLPQTYPRTPFLPHLEVLRGVAVLLVLAYHAGVAAVPGGYVGVDVFFVLSGFLITNHLLVELSARGRISFTAFYARRAQRLLPAALTVILVTVLVVVVAAPPRLAETIFSEARAAVLFVPNLLFAVRETEYLAEASTSPLLHYWSLGVEEQFYLAWPLLLLVVWRTTRGRRPRTIAAIAALVVLSLALSVVLSTVNGPWAYFSPLSRAWELGIGALIAAARLHDRRWRPGLAAFAVWLGLAAIAAAALLFDESTVFPGVAALLPTVGAALVVVGGAQVSTGATDALLRHPVMRFFGRISYSLYLVHWPMLTLPVVLSATGSDVPALFVAALVGASILVAWVLHVTIERPVLRSKGVTALGGGRLLAITAVALAVSLGAVQVGSAAVAAKPLATGIVVGSPTPLAASPEGSPVFTTLVPADLTPDLKSSASDLPQVYADGCQLSPAQSAPLECVYGVPDSDRRMVLFGDSHAAQWFPALEQLALDEGFRLESHTKSSCPPFDVALLDDGVVDEACASWRASVLDLLEVSPPEVVVLSGFAHYDEFGNPDLTTESWTDGVRETVERLAQASDVVVIDDTPRFPRTPALCLSANLDDAAVCSIPRAEAIDEEWALGQREAVESAGGRAVSFNDLLCSAGTCGTILGNILMYRDQHHLSTSIVRWLEPAVAAAILDRAGQSDG